MPILSPSVLGSFQTVRVGGQAYLLESFSQTQNNPVEPKTMIQGTLGTKIMDVGGITYKTSVNSSALIGSASGYSDVFALIDYYWKNIRSGSPSLPLLEKAEIKVSKDGVTCSANFLSDSPGSFTVTPGSAGDVLARVSKWYDTVFYVNGGTTNSIVGAVESANIDLSTKITPRFFVGATDQLPFFSIETYSISGSVTIVADANSFSLPENFIGLQTRGTLTLTGPTNIGLTVGGVSISLGVASMKSSIDKSVKAGDVLRITFNFQSYT